MIKNIIKVIVLVLVNAFLFLEGLKLIHNTKPVPQVLYSIPETIVIDDFIGNHSILREGVHMPTKTKELVELVRGGASVIHIKLNSPGGFMGVGMRFVDVMRGARDFGVKLVCVVDGKAMSMALIIFSECDERYATFGSKLMWHSIARGVNDRVNEASASKLLDFMQAKNEEVWANTRIHFYPWYFTKHFGEESVLSASEVEKNSIYYLRVIQNYL